MKSKSSFVYLVVLLASPAIFGQGILIDQQSTNLVEGVAFIGNGNEPMGQSFTPTLSSVEFVLLNLYDGDVFQHLGGTLYVNLRSNSITGTVLSSTTPVFMPSDFFGVTNFVFSTPVAVTPGVTYYFELLIEPGSDGFGSYVTDGSYTRGSSIYQGVAAPGNNLWFQEGVFSVPEPSSAALVLLGGAWMLVQRRRNK